MREDRERERERERGRYESSSERGRSESSPERWRESRMVWGEGAYGGRERTREFDDERSERGSGYTRGARQRYSGGLGSGAGMGMPESSGMGYTGGSSYGGAGYAGTGYGNTGYTWSGMQGRNERNHYGRGPKGYQRSDQRIEEDVNEALYRDHDVDASEVEVKVAGGEVTLNGTVEDRAMKRHAEDCACAVPGVKNVMNQIRVSPHRSSEQGFGRTQQHEDETRNRRSTPSHKMGA
jgi:osmotically-inducible protein OsmY